MRASEAFRESVGDAWSRAARHAFVDQLGDGTLPAEAWRRYLIDDYAFITHLASILGAAIASAPDMRAKARLAGFLAALTSEENDFFLRSLDQLGVEEAEWRNAEMSPTMQAFADHMHAAVRDHGYPGALAALLPAEWIYLDWATWLTDARPPPSAYTFQEWIWLHASPDFVAFVAWLGREVDRTAADADASTVDAMQEIFARMVELEVAFFDWSLGG